MSGLPLASLGAQFNWEPSERPSGTLPGIVSLRVGKQEVLSTNSPPFLGAGCSWALVPQHSGPACMWLGRLRTTESSAETEVAGMLGSYGGDLLGRLRGCGLQAATLSLLITATPSLASPKALSWPCHCDALNTEVTFYGSQDKLATVP